MEGREGKEDLRIEEGFLMNPAIFAITLLYPIAVTILMYVLGGNSLWESLKGAYYLFAGWFIFYAGIMMLVLSLVGITIPVIADLIFFSVGYFAIYFFRTYMQTETHDILETISPKKT